jgi:hypothetical protein
VSRDFRLHAGFFPRISFSQAHEGSFKFFRKFAEIFAGKGAPLLSLTQVANGKSHKSEKLLLLEFSNSVRPGPGPAVTRF